MPEGPANQGYALPAMTATFSRRAAAEIRAASVGRADTIYEIPAASRGVLDQDKLPCCVSCALGSAMEILNPSWPALAPLFHYHVARFEEIGVSDGEGFLNLPNALATLAKTGICSKDLHGDPHGAFYTDEGAREKVSNDARIDAFGRRGRSYLPVDGPSKAVWICEQLRQNRPVVIGFQLPISYESSFLDSSSAWLDPSSSLSSAGHCVLATGYNDHLGGPAKGAIHIQDSHGTGRFAEGRWWMGYRVVDDPKIFHDAYSLVP